MSSPAEPVQPARSQLLRLALPPAAAVLLAYGIGKAWTWTVIGEAFGTLGLLYLVASLVLTLRGPKLAELVGGLENMYVLHRQIGMAGYVALLAHPLLLATVGEWQTLSPAAKTSPFIAAWAGLLLLMAALLFTFLLKPRAYAGWRTVHGLASPAFVLIGWHALDAAADWPLAAYTALLITLLIGGLAIVLRWLVVEHGFGAARYTVHAVARPTARVVDVVLRPQGGAITLQAGQFVFCRFSSKEAGVDCGHFHPFTVSSILADGALRLSIKALGPCTTAMQSVKPQVTALLQGPFGNLFQHVRKETQVWIAAGIGITPFLARARNIDPHGMTIKLFYMYSHENEAAFLTELRAIAAEKPNLELYPTLMHRQLEVALSVLDALLPPWNDKDYVLCGPPTLMIMLRTYLASHHVPERQIHEERFDFR